MSADDLPLPDGPTMPEQRGAGEPRDHLGDEALAAEEDVGVVDLERGEALERAGDGVRAGRRAALAGGLQRDDVGGEVVLAARRSRRRGRPPRPAGARAHRRRVRRRRRPRRAPEPASGCDGLGVGQVERGVLAEDRVVEAAQLRAGLDADRLDERRARVPVGVQRVGLAAAAVEREHPQAVQALAQRLAVPPARRARRSTSAWRPAARSSADRLLDRREPQLLEPADLERRERLGGDVVERRAAPQRERVARRARGDEALEAADVEVAPVAEAQLVAAPARDDLRAVAGGRERLAEMRDVALDHLRRGRRRRLAPQPVDQLLGRDRRALAEREHRQHRPRLARADRDGLIAVAGLHGSEHSKIHGQGSLSDSTLLAPSREPQGPIYRDLPQLYRRATAVRDGASRPVPPPPRRGFR